jgi:hypothetical protein
LSDAVNFQGRGSVAQQFRLDLRASDVPVLGRWDGKPGRKQMIVGARELWIKDCVKLKLEMRPAWSPPGDCPG